MTKIAFYVRVSTKQHQDYQRQIDILNSYINEKGITDEIDIYGEKQSGYKDDREELHKLLDKIKDDKNYYACVYITEISRLGRNTRRVREALEIFKENKVNLYIKQLGVYLLNEDGTPNAHGNLLLSIFIELSDAESVQAKERFKSGILSGIMAGNVGGGKFKPYGFTKGDDKKLIIDDEEAHVVRLIFDLYKAGNGIKVIAGILNNKGIPTRANKSFGEEQINSKTGKQGKDVIWQDKTVDDILLNPIYKGQRRYWGGKENKRNKTQPRLIEMKGETLLNPPSIYDECLEVRNSKTHKNYLTSYVYLLKDKLICGRCGRNYFAKYKPTPQGDKVYICSSRLKKNGNCGNVGVNISFLESAIFNEIVSSDSILKHINNKDEIKKRLQEDLEKLKTMISTCEAKSIKLDKDIDSLIELQLMSKRNYNFELEQKYTNRISANINEIANLRKQKVKAQSTLLKTENALKKRSNPEITTKELIEFKNDRIKLRSVYMQIIDKIIINNVTQDTILANAFISIDGIVLPSTLKLILDLKGMRKKEKSYCYIPIADLNYKLEYESNILKKTSITNLQHLIHLVHEESGSLDWAETTHIHPEYILEIK